MKLSILILSILLSIGDNAFANTPDEVTIGSYLPDATLNGFSGNTKKFSSYRGKPLIINIWASWCGPCREEIGSLERLSHRFGGKQINVIGISTDDDASAAAAFIKDSKPTFTNYLDSNVRLEICLVRIPSHSRFWLMSMDVSSKKCTVFKSGIIQKLLSSSTKSYA